MRGYKLFASRATYVSNNSKELKAVDAQDMDGMLAAQDELWEDGYEINEIWYPSEEGEQTEQRRPGRRNRR